MSHPTLPRRTLALAAVASLSLAAVACSSDGDASDDRPGVTIVDDGTAGGSTDETTDSTIEATGDEPTRGGDLLTADAGEATAGRWAVGEAGEVEFTLDGGTLDLVDAAPAEGWELTLDEEAADEIEITFRRGGETHRFEVQVDDGRLEIEIDREIDPAEPGTFELGPAGTVELAVDGERVTLVDLQPTDGWEVVEREQDDDEVQVELRRGAARWELDAELDDGRFQVQIDLTLTSPLP